MKAIVTGGHGFLGSYIVEELRARGWDVFSPASMEYDLRLPHVFDSMWGRFPFPNVIVHAAAAVGGIGANTANPGRFFFDNMRMGMNVIDGARRFDAPKVVTVGTACMYPEFAPMPLVESKLYDGCPAEATAPYAFAKRAVMEMGQAYRKEYRLNAVFVIPTNLYGPRDNFDPERGHVIPSMIQRFMSTPADGVVSLWGSGQPTRDFLYAADAARGIVDVVEQYDEPEPLNLGSGVETRIRDLAETVSVLTGFTGSILWDESRPNGTPRRLLSTERAEVAIGWKPEIALDDGLERTIEWYKRQY